MRNDSILYSKVVTPASEAEDGETPTRVILTQEVNCWICWLEGYNHAGHVLFVEKLTRNRAIERAVAIGKMSEAGISELVVGGYQ